MTHGSLFSGFGGFDLAAEWAGFTNVFHCEINPFCQKILKYYWPLSHSYTDITKTNFKNYEKKIDIISGGFPCQPFSSAGKRKGTADSRHLWPEMYRTIQEIKPRWIVGENVFGITNWNGGMVFNQVCIDLENAGYEVQTFIIPAAAVNAPHRRDRVFFIAYADSECYGSSKYRSLRQKNEKIKGKRTQTFHNVFGSISNSKIVTNTDNNGRNKRNNKNEKLTNKKRINAQCNINKIIINTENIRLEKSKENRKLEGKRFEQSSQGDNWRRFPTVSPFCFGNDGISNKLDRITFRKWREETIKAAGNAIVPQVVFEIFKAIKIFDEK